MSGGSYNYLYGWPNSDPLPVGAIEDMADRAEELAPGSKAAKDLATLRDQMKAILALWPALEDVMHDIEWADSGDYSDDQAIEAIVKYGAKP